MGNEPTRAADALRRTTTTTDTSKADTVARQIAQLVVSRQLAAGGLLASEKELSRHYGISRPNIRLALRRLSTAGLVDTHHGVGTFVNPPDAWNLFDPMLLHALLQDDDLSAIAEELVELRRMVEVECAGLAATHIDAQGLQRLERSVQQMGEALDDVVRISRIDLGFHDVIMEASHNRFLQGIMAYVREPLEQARFLTMQTGGSEGRARAHQSHRAIYQAIAARDVRAARAAMAEHMRQLEHDMRNALQAPQGRRAPGR
jgi:DNA-binding FadR family transcriptional regulator